MKSVFRALFMAFGMFSVIPAPKVWDESSAKHVMLWLPVVGAVIGTVWLGAAEVLGFFQLPMILAAAILMIMPYILAGFIHLDGYMDASDAILSRRSLEEKLRILKDPHTGAFAVIMIAILFIINFAAVYAFIDRGEFILMLPVIPVLSRCCCAMSVLCLRPMAQEGYAYVFKPAKAAPHRGWTAIIVCAAFTHAWFSCGASGLIIAGAVMLGYAAAMLCALAGFKFKGVSGDLAGFSLVISELCGIFACAAIRGGF